MAPHDGQPPGAPRRLVPWLAGLLVACLAPPTGQSPAAEAEAPLPQRVEFNRDIRPILADRCWHCHGPDSAARRGDLRLDRQEHAHADRGGYRVVAPGDISGSELARRIRSPDPDLRMPPPDQPRQLVPREIALLERWIEQGGDYQPHWALLAPRAVSLPPVRDRDWPRGAIDYFVLAELEARNLRPSPPADGATLLRRVTLDLTGLPPAPEEVERFLADGQPGAYERLVDRLLSSPRYGERMALRWLDIARFADSGGYQGDILRSMWLWRDWVIDAYNRNLPFDRFTRQQLAGDLLPGTDQRHPIATGFHRNHRINDEDGIVPEEFRVEYVADRVETTAAAWLALTVGCARCHDHKYDPIAQREYYQLFAFFNSIDEQGRGHGNAPPLLTVVTPALARQLETLDRQIEAFRAGEASPQATPGASVAESLEQLQRRRSELRATAPTVMVMRERDPPRPTHVLMRGAYDRPGERVEAGTPEAIGPPFHGFRPDRRGLADWLLDRRNPLTARVAVNRYWHMLFGRGLVETLEDFGTQGQLPSHPRLLDWLAIEFRRSGWDVKAMLRQIVTSATYRQASAGTPELLAKDPANRWLGRGPRYRLPAELLRDQALAASGLLVERLGGPSVRPYQPPGLWRELVSASRDYQPGQGSDLYRRGMYTFIRRTVPPPALAALDAPNREVCTLRRPRTNTPLQALVLMNDPTWVEAARGMAVRTLRDAPQDDADRLRYAFRLLLVRAPEPEELQVLRESLEYYRARYRQAPGDARRLLAVGQAAPAGEDHSLERLGAEQPGELAAWTAVCSLLLNLDETVTKE